VKLQFFGWQALAIAPCLSWRSNFPAEKLFIRQPRERGIKKTPKFLRKGERIHERQQKRFLETLRRRRRGERFGHHPEADRRACEGAKIKYAKETTTVCPYCSVGCSIIVSVRDGKVVNTEGDPDSPINRGSLCSKGGSIYQMAVNENRLGKPLYRAPFATEWKEVEWEWAFEKIAENVKKSRDASFKKTNAKGELVNRTEGIASVGSAAMDLEECFTYQKFLRGLGLVYIEHQARI